MIDIKNTNTSELLNQANEIFDQTRPFAELMMRYKCAMLEVKTKLDVLNTQLSLENDRNPFESIECRLKSVPSIIEKLNRKGLELSAESIEKNLNDVAGIRVICSFPSYRPQGLHKRSEAERLPQPAFDSGNSDFPYDRKEIHAGRGAVQNDCNGLLGKP